MNKLFKIKQCFFILLLIFLAGFLAFPKISLANGLEDINPEKIKEYLELPEKEAEEILRTFIQLLTDDWIDITASSENFSPEKQAVLIIVKKAVQKNTLNYAIDFFTQITGKIAKEVIETAVIVYSGGSSAFPKLLDKFEKESVEQAVKYAENWLLQNEIKSSVGVLNANSYISYKKNIQTPIFQYVMAYKPINSREGKIVVKIYSSNKIEPPGAKHFLDGLSWDLYSWLSQGNEKIPPFIIEIAGRIRKTEDNYYIWINERGERIVPFPKISFPPQVPDFGLRPMNFLERQKAKIISYFKNELKKKKTILGEFAKKLEEIKEGLENLSKKSNNFVNKSLIESAKNKAKEIYNNIKTIISQFDLSRAGLVEIPDSDSLQQPEQKIVKNKESYEVRPRKIGKGEVTDLRPPQVSQISGEELMELQEKIDDISEEIDILSQRIAVIVKKREKNKKITQYKIDGAEEAGKVEKTEKSKKIEQTIELASSERKETESKQPGIDNEGTNQLENHQDSQNAAQNQNYSQISQSQNQEPEPFFIDPNIKYIKISEIQLSETELVELYNSFNQSVSLKGCYLSYYSKDRDWSEPLRSWALPDEFISSNSHYLIEIYNPQEDNLNPDLQIKTQQGDFYSKGQLNNKNGAIAIFPFDPRTRTSSEAQSDRIDAVGWGESLVKEKKSANPCSDGESLARKWNRYTNQYQDFNDNYEDFEIQNPTPAAKSNIKIFYSSGGSSENSKGQSSDDSPESAGEDSYSGSDASATDTTASTTDSTSTTTDFKILISEIQLASKNSSNDEFIELYNPNAQEVSLDSWSIQKTYSTSTVVYKKNFEKENKIPAHGYFLIVNSNATSSLKSLAETNGMIHNSFSLAENNTVYLVRNTEEIENALDTDIVDMLGFGENVFSEGNPTKNPQKGETIGRKWSTSTENYIDTNDNQQDFKIQEPTPKAKNQPKPKTEKPKKPEEKSKEPKTQESKENQPPLALFSYSPKEPVINQVITFNAASSTDADGEIVSFVWDFGSNGDILATEQATTTYSYSSSTEYIVSLTVIDNYSATGTCTTTITIHPLKEEEQGKEEQGEQNKKEKEEEKEKNNPPSASFVYSPENPFVGDEIYFNADSSADSDGEIILYKWDFGDGSSTTTTQATTTHSYSNSCTSTVTLIVTDNDNATSSCKKDIFIQAVETPEIPLQTVVINEIAWMGTAFSPNDEWIELYNNSEQDIDLMNWEITKDGEKFIIISTSTAKSLATTTIPAHQFYLLESTDDNTISNISADFIYKGNLKLNNSGNKLELRDQNGNLIDLVDCSENWFAGINENLGDSKNPKWARMSMERIDPTLSGNEPTNWMENDGVIISSSGKDASGKYILGTPKAENSRYKFPGKTIVPANTIISQPTIWTKKSSPYIVQGRLHIGSNTVLYIEPGVVIKFYSGDDCEIYIQNAALKAKGTSDSPIIFTSYLDDLEDLELELKDIEKDTNQDGTSTSPIIGQGWDRINVFPESKLELEHCIIRYGGYHDYPNWSYIIFTNHPSSSIVLRHSKIEKNGGGIRLLKSSAVIDDVEFIANTRDCLSSFEISNSSPIITNSHFKNNSTAIWIGENSFPVIENNVFEENNTPILINSGKTNPIIHNNQTQNNDYDGIVLENRSSGSILEILEEMVFEADLPYIVPAGLVVKPGAKLKLNPNTVIKFKEGKNFKVQGNLNAEGIEGNPIIFTSLNKDKYWEGLRIKPQATSTLKWIEIKRAGYEGADPLIIEGEANISQYEENKDTIFIIDSYAKP